MLTRHALPLGLLIVLAGWPVHAEPTASAPPSTVITNPSHLLSAEDLKSITAAATVYLEGEEVIFSLTALSADAVRVNIGRYYSPTRSHGMKFTLHRTKTGWIENRQDQTELWNQ